MAEPTNADVLDSIARLRAALTSDFAPPGKAPVSELKHSLVENSPRITTEEFIKNHFSEIFGQIKAMNEEVVKTPWQEIMELLGFDKIVKGIEEFFKGGFMAAFSALLLGVVQLMLPVILIALGAVVIGAIRWAMTKAMKGKVMTMNGPKGPFAVEKLEDVQKREARKANGGTSLADLVSDPANAANARKLREQLVPLNKAVDRFDKLAPTFLDLFRKLPSERKANKAALGVERISDAVKLVDRPALKEVTENIEKLNKPTGLASTVTKMGELVTKTETLRDKFNGLKGAVSSLDQIITGTAS
ncbi:hypothetical protein [Streptomyces sp. NPDC093089]|uniref:hypothetical protein n=1 Tax=Streptomyces sp. NPDC093089 TaxID=3366024 RepID=UPI0037FC95EE